MEKISFLEIIHVSFSSPFFLILPIFLDVAITLASVPDSLCTDLNCGSYFRLYLKDAFNAGLINMSDIDNALLRLFNSRIKLGVFDPPFLNPYSTIPSHVIDSDEHKKLAHQIAKESIVLLRNEDNNLPLEKSIKSVAVIGPNANFCRFGTYSGKSSISLPLPMYPNIGRAYSI